MSNDNFFNLLEDLKNAAKELWTAEMLVHDLSNKYAPLCVKILVEGRKIPKLINNRIEKRKAETGLDPVHPDFWDADMIIALYEHFENMEVANAGAY